MKLSFTWTLRLDDVRNGMVDSQAFDAIRFSGL